MSIFDIFRKRKPIPAPWSKYYNDDELILNIPNISVYKQLLNTANKYPNNIAYRYFGKNVSFKTFIKQIDKAAISLLEAAMNKKTKALTTEQYKAIIHTMKEGFCGCRPNERIATILALEGNLGMRISDILKLRLCDIVRDGDRFRLEVVEQKTGKRRVLYIYGEVRDRSSCIKVIQDK